MKFKPKYLGSLQTQNNIELLKQFLMNDDLLGTKYHQAKFIQLTDTIQSLIGKCAQIKQNINESEDKFNFKISPV